MHFQTIVLGLGAMGSATTYQLAKRSCSVLGIDQLSPPHPYGSTHGDTRITRQAVGEGAQYPPLALRSHGLWRDLERETDRSLLNVTGGLIISSPARGADNHVANFFANTLAAARRHGIAHEVLDAPQIRARFPAFNVRDDEIGYWEPGAGFLLPEACIQAQLELAVRLGAVLHMEEKVRAFHQDGRKVVVQTDRAEYSADTLIVTAGPWLPALLESEYAQQFTVTRQVLYWFDPQDTIAPFLPERFPVFIWEPQGANQALYGFPAIDGPQGGVKVAPSRYGSPTTPETIERAVNAEEIATMYDNLVAPFLPGLSNRCVKAITCLYTVTPDAAFVIDRLPESSQVIIASPCSGHGFKHSAAIGEALAELATTGRTSLDLSAFGWRRPTP